MKLKNVTHDHLLSVMQVCAQLEAEFTEDESMRCYHFYPEWSDGVAIATYENGGGDDLVIIFKDNNVLIKGFDHESEVSPYAQEEYKIWPGMYQGAPKYLIDILDEGPFEKDHVTFCYWLLNNEIQWEQGPVVYNDGEDDGSSWLLSAIKFNSKLCTDWIKEYFELEPGKIPHKEILNAFTDTSRKNIGYGSLYYCTYQNNEILESADAIRVNDTELTRILKNVLDGNKNFVGFIDGSDTTLQFYVEAKDKVWLDIPVTKNNGSYGMYISGDVMLEIVKSLNEPYIKYLDKLNLEFQSWT